MHRFNRISLFLFSGIFVLFAALPVRATTVSFVTVPTGIATTVASDVTFEFNTDVSGINALSLYLQIDDAFVSPQSNFTLLASSSTLMAFGQIPQSGGVFASGGIGDTRDYLLRFSFTTIPSFSTGEQVVLTGGTHTAPAFGPGPAMVSGDYELAILDSFGNVVADSVPEPSAVVLLLTGVCCLLLKRRR